MIRQTIVGFWGVACTALALHASTITVDTGTSAQNLVLTGLGPVVISGGTYGTWAIQQGSCTASAGTTTCTFSGALAAGGSPGFTSGTFSLITAFATSDVNPIQGISASVDPGSNANYFYYSSFAPDVSMVLDLNTTGGTYDVPLATNGNFDAGVSLSFLYTGTEVCTLVATCSQANVGLVNGATISGPVDIEATFTAPVPEPSPGFLVLTGLLFMVVLVAWSRIAQSL